MMLRPTIAVVAAGFLSIALLGACGGSDEAASSEEQVELVVGPTSLLEAQRLTVLDQRIRYPKRSPVEVSSEVRVIEPGQETGWRRNRVPSYVYVLEGSITMDYDNGVTREFTAGDAYMEAQGVWHNGTNKSTEPVRLLSVHLGARGLENYRTRP
jgi:quercetin dioxygenase-like cupin family protein